VKQRSRATYSAWARCSRDRGIITHPGQQSHPSQRSIVRKLLRESNLHWLPVYSLVMQSDLGREGIINSGSYRLADRRTARGSRKEPSALRSTRATCQPLSASARAVTRPIPAGLPAPVTTAVRGSGNGDKTVEVAGPAAVIAAPSLRCLAQSIKVARMSRI
jgi:hypothetical protein